MSFPFDGTPQGDMMGFQMEEDRRRLQQDATDSIMSSESTPRTAPNLIAFLLGLAVVLFVIFYGTEL